MTDPLAPLMDLPGVAAGVDSARNAVDTLLNNRVLRRKSTEVSTESSLRGAWASAWLSGAKLSLDDVRAGTSPVVSDPTLQGALRAQAAIGTLTDTWTRAPRQVLARLHVLAAADLVEDRETLGRPRELASTRLDILADVLAATSAPAVVVGAIVHAEVLSLDAFAPASGVVARVANRLTLIERGLDPNSLVVIEAGHRELEQEYIEALAAYRTSTPAGVGVWIRHCCEAVVTGARETTAICEAIARG
ncbi:oxidoreductase [Jatrophihabitans sp. GAS493]|uniref:oxidoreductase n=1 Tax=Jatrophihabitans sp. GAS493 TaxID=1907575 RepID=UPI0012FD4817|nr:oxidoreductase [Jatrophihabitans sp. GAS493]